MINYIKGTIEEIHPGHCIIENNGMGYELMASAFTLKHLTLGKQEKIYTQLIVKEDDLLMAGFINIQELEMYHHLNSVSKIGPKLALTILSTYSHDQVARMIMSSDIISLSKISGLGKKTSERIVLELKDKFTILDFVPSRLESSLEDDVIIETIDALINLGFSRKQSEDAVRQALEVTEDKRVEVLLKKSLSLIQSL